MNPQWLVRTHQNRILGPMSQEELSKKVLAGEFSTQDEICPGDGYWMYLHEKDEVKKRLGIEAPLQPKKKRKHDDDDVTETETETETDMQTLTATEVPIEMRAKPAPRTAAAAVTPQNYRVEQPSILKGVVIFLVVALLVILAQVFKIAKSNNRPAPSVHEAIGESLTVPGAAGNP